MGSRMAGEQTPVTSGGKNFLKALIYKVTLT